MQIAGHSDEGKGVHFKVYTHSVGLRELQETLNRVSYPHDFATLRLADPTFSAFFATPDGRTAEEKQAAKNALNAKHIEAKARREEWNKPKPKNLQTQT
jgi:hypothetical protein